MIKISKNMSDNKLTNFEKELQHLINRYSLENGSNTPDFILAKYLVSCLESFNNTVKSRQKWYAPYPGQNERVDVFDIGTSNGTEKDIVSSVFSCNHTNEVPTKCPCAGECYCRRNTCQVKMKGPYSEIPKIPKEIDDVDFNDD